ncbi:hypothetical protein [Miltoncostaea marina]|uniref:hypothetical protein n=1 Tax=Miltoncostaea marina TaxID=2843215 RepID=UPI001C3C5C5F|nr:hypothetical protein [Miltoncostaea marina]
MAGTVLVVLLAAGMRLAFMLSPAGRFDGDEAVTGIMAQRILGGELYAFFAGQTYMGAFEQYLQAAVLAVAPDTHTALRVVPFVIATATAAAVVVLGRRVTGSTALALLAGALFALGPYYNVVKGVRSHGAYASAALAVVLVAVLALAVDPRARRSRWTAAALGIACGFALWESTLTAYVLIPAVLWGLGSARGALRRLLPPALAGAVVGAAPLIVHRAIHGPFAASGRPPQPHSEPGARLENLLRPVLDQFLGARELGGVTPVTGWIPPALVSALALAALGAAAWSRRRGLRDLVLLRRGERRPVDLLIAAALVCPPIYILSDYTWFTGEPRYIFTLYPVLAVLLAAAVGAVRPRALAAAVACLLVALVGGLSAAQLAEAIDADGYPPIQAGGVVRTEHADEVADALEAERVTAVYADYWVAYPLQYAAGDRLAVSAFADQRFPELEAAVAASREPPAYVAPEGDGAAAIAASLRDTGTRFRTRRVEGYVLFLDLSERRTPREIGQPR